MNIQEELKERKQIAKELAEFISAIPLLPENKELILTKSAEFKALVDESEVMHNENLSVFKGQGYCVSKNRLNSIVEFKRLRAAKL